MAGGYQVVVVTPLLMEGTELDETVAHHVGIGRQACPHLVHGVACHLVPILPMAVHHLEPTPIAGRHSGSHLKVFLAGAVPLLLLLGTYLDVEAVGVQPLAGQLIHHHRTVHTARKQYGYLLVSQLF